MKKHCDYRRGIRPERTFEQYSRGAELVRAIRKLWQENEKLQGFGRNHLVNDNIEALMDDFDLTLDEWFYWSKTVRGESRG